MKLVFSLLLLISSQFALAGEPMVWFGKLEVQNGALKSADGSLPHSGSNVTLRVFAQELALKVYDASPAYMGGYGAYGYTPHLFVRFKNEPNWKEVVLSTPGYQIRGVYFFWKDYEDVELNLPADADRIEAWLKFDRVRPTDCYLGYDIMECPTLQPWDPAFLSNQGRNFKIDVR